MTVHFTLSWWLLAIIWFAISVLIVVVRNAFMDDGNDCGIGTMVLDLPVLLIGIFGAIGIIVGHFL